MAATSIRIGSSHLAPALCASDEFQWTSSLGAGAACAPAEILPAVASAPEKESRRFLLGLPCTHCGAYSASDEERCPVCQRPRR
jgi:hypothetical protein